MTNEQLHLQTLDEAIAELIPLTEITAAPAPRQYQYVGTVIENTLVLLTGVANSLDQGSRNIQFSDFVNWISAMQAVHRSFYSSIIMAVEISLTEFCQDEGITVKSGRLAQAESIIADLGDALNGRNKKRILSLAGGDPAFLDYVRSAVQARLEKPDRRDVWIKFFDALSVIRNKASHSDVTLSESQQKKLAEGGCGVLVSDDGNLQLNSRNYKQVVDCVMQFYQELGIYTQQDDG
jgi:hypothetical protein